MEIKKILDIFIRIIKRLIAWVILTSIGWSIPDECYYKNMFNEDRLVIVFSHTSYWDTVLFLLYTWLYPIYTDYIVSLINPTTFEKYGSILSKMGFIPATRLEDKGKGCVKNVIDKLKDKPKSHLMISPKGTLKKSEWRSGYYWIAKGLNAKVVVVGLDYQKKAPLFGAIHQTGNDLSKLEAKLKRDIGSITPLYPEQEYYCYDKKHCTVINKLCLISCILTIVNIYYLWRLSIICQIIMAFVGITSRGYQQSTPEYEGQFRQETNISMMNNNRMFITLFSIIYWLYLVWYRMIPTNIYWHLLMINVVLLYNYYIKSYCNNIFYVNDSIIRLSLYLSGSLIIISSLI